MIAIDDLLKLGEQVKADEARRAEEEQAKKQAAYEQRLELAANTLITILGIDEETFVGFKPIAVESGSSRLTDFMFTLNYWGSELKVRVFGKRLNSGDELLEVEVQSVKADSPRAALAKWLLETAQKFEAAKSDVVRKLNSDAAGFYSDYIWTSNNCKKVWNEPEVIAARVAYLLKLAPNRSRKNVEFFGQWLAAAEQLTGQDAIAAVIEQKRLDRQYVDDRERLTVMLRDRRDPATGERNTDFFDEDYGLRDAPVTVEEIATYEAEINDAGIWTDEIREMFFGLRNQLKEQTEKAEQERRRQQAELDAFKPFRYYIIRYSLIGDNEDGDGEERMVVCKDFGTLHEQPDENGFYHMLIGFTIKPRNLAAVLMSEVRTVEELKALPWSHKFMRDTDFGRICVVPDGAELIEMEGNDERI